ncbi:unnamed protein product [Caenorhabditis bovis]|uniref:Uncharacterized protein n=1 Tax=Caenorhabditis bovis TaxID=2654633 RepID=A0A8S1F569_9PELO|nr:unnamed protein product [Caenorhabditis bovis]
MDRCPSGTNSRAADVGFFFRDIQRDAKGICSFCCGHRSRWDRNVKYAYQHNESNEYCSRAHGDAVRNEKVSTVENEPKRWAWRDEAAASAKQKWAER